MVPESVQTLVVVETSERVRPESIEGLRAIVEAV